MTSTKQALDRTTGLIAAASGDDAIFSNIIDLASTARAHRRTSAKAWVSNIAGAERASNLKESTG